MHIMYIYMHILSLLAYISLTFHSGTAWSNVVMWDLWKVRGLIQGKCIQHQDRQILSIPS